MALALERNGELLAARQQVAAARGGLSQARLRPNPSLEFNDAQEMSGGMNNFMIGGSVPLELFHRRDRRVEVAAGRVRVSEFDQAENQRRLREVVASKFGEALAATRNVQFTKDLLALNRKALELTQIRADQGSGTPLDANLLRVEVSRIDALRVDFEAKLGVSLLELKSLAGMRPEEDLRLNGTLEAEALALDQDASLKAALESRPDLLSARAAERVADARLKLARTDARPDASISANYLRMDSRFDLNGLTATGQLRPVQGIFHYASVGFSVSLPVRNRNQGAIATAVAELEETKRRREYAELIAAREIAAGFLAREKAKESLDIYRVGVRERAGQNLEVIRRTYELGRTQLLDVIAEQRRFIDIEMGYTDTLNRYYQASVRVQAAADRW